MQLNSIKKALVTGASSGIGETFARELASRKVDLVLVARSRDQLDRLASELQGQHGIQVQVIAKDLTEPDATPVVFDAVAGGGETVDLLINNAGFGDYGPFETRSLDKQMQMVQLNIGVLVGLTYRFLSAMKPRNRGAIVNVSSIAAYQPLPYLSVYSASKAFVLNFTEALWAENQDSGVRILALCPGPTESNFFDAAEFPASFRGAGNSLTPAEEVVKDTLAALEKDFSTLVTGGLSNQIIVNLPRLLPRDTIVGLVEKQFRPN
ncbi:SDR family oxidoreductase [Lyngbya sp. CCY1209]|uniref:SDR family NAD(P)-dependent oxidoreductase n=1 Tax=Lyngbya sp. CCY1209 TaxID=2886103 RepID=UPI002D217447|nr:SDR family oxidoreductase [Lyngbya sp. CCY1209]MEB3883341.1 SDR family oxidoreductase [Lyngbya sp. CCY1209]